MSGVEQVLVPALVSGVVALIVAILTAGVALRSQSVETRKQQAQLRREMTKMLYEKRLALYPKFMQLTEPLRASKIAAGPADSAYFRAALDALEAHNSGEAGLVISTGTLDCYYELRLALRDEPSSSSDKFSSAQIERVKNARAKFRTSLRHDMRLVYAEEFGSTGA